MIVHVKNITIEQIALCGTQQNCYPNIVFGFYFKIFCSNFIPPYAIKINNWLILIILQHAFLTTKHDDLYISGMTQLYI